MPDRVALIFADAQQATEPSGWQSFCRKIEKTGWAAVDHRKAEIGVAVVATAISVGLGVITGGLSLAIQFGIGMALGLGQRTAGRLAGYADYERNKEQIEAPFPTDVAASDRKKVRMAYKNFHYNEGHFQDCIYAMIAAYKDLQARMAGHVRSEEDLSALISAIVVFKDEYDRALHYFYQFERFVEFEAKYLTAATKAYNTHADDWEDLARETVKQNRAWHKSTCRKSSFKTDICYGLHDSDHEIGDSTGGNAHHRMV